MSQPEPPKKAIVYPTSRLGGRLSMPPDKSVSHRALMLGALGAGATEITNLLDAEDNHSTRAVLRELGVRIEDSDTAVVRVHGRGELGFATPSGLLDCGNSGTTMRLMTGMIAGMGVKATLVGDASLNGRPMGRIVKPLREMGLSVRAEGNGQRPPVVVEPDGAPTEPEDGFSFDSPIASAQVKSAVLFAGLGLGWTMMVREPAPSRDHTERLLRYLGYRLQCTPNYQKPDGMAAAVGLYAKIDRPHAGRPITVPGDISSAAFWMVAAALTEGSDVTLENVNTNPTRTGILDALGPMGVAFQFLNRRVLPGGEPVADIRITAAQLKPSRIGGGMIPRLIDEIPVLAVLAAGIEGETIICDAAELRVKESDRLVATARLLSGLGCDYDEREDGLAIRGPAPFKAFSFDADGDHRMAMAAAVAALRADGPCEIIGADACAVSYASFFQDLTAIGGVVHEKGRGRA